MNTALFLDRDGVINKRLVGEYVRTPDEFHLLDDVLPIMQQAKAQGHLLILISNQQGVGKGLMSQSDLDAVHQHMQQVLLDRVGFGIDAIYTCTALASANDPRRKPSPGMLLEAMRDHDVDPARSWFIGDSLTDAEAGRAAGVRTVLVGAYPADAADIVVHRLADVPALAD